MRTGLYYHLDSNGEDTNLQLYSLLAAGREWQALRVEHGIRGADATWYHSRCCHVVMLCGASVVQLAGQNDPEPGHRPDSPRDIIDRMASAHVLIAEVVDAIRTLISHYDAVRHFGLSGSGVGHNRVTEIDFDVARTCVETTREFWRRMVQIFGNRDPAAEYASLVKIDEFLPPP